MDWRDSSCRLKMDDANEENGQCEKWMRYGWVDCKGTTFLTGGRSISSKHPFIPLSLIHDTLTVCYAILFLIQHTAAFFIFHYHICRFLYIPLPHLLLSLYSTTTSAAFFIFHYHIYRFIHIPHLYVSLYFTITPPFFSFYISQPLPLFFFYSPL